MDSLFPLVAVAAIVGLVVLFSLWRSADAEVKRLSATVTSQIESRARALHQDWQQAEIAVIRDQQLEVARREAASMLKEWKLSEEDGIRRDAIHRSRAVTFGQITEHVVPYFPESPFNPKDVRFIGNPIDFVVFDGLSAGDVRQLLIAEVKTSNSALNTRQRQIKEVVNAGRVGWYELRLQIDSAAVGDFSLRGEVNEEPRQPVEQLNAPGTLHPGATVRHAQFGVGTVISVEELDDDTKVVVRFELLGVRTLRTKYASLDVL